jgi:D-beta-D-heptose 7-phosphate kinase/D-beta-D-heptose 1-phosphate adenosyltransferase
MTEIERGNIGSVQGLSVAVDTHRQHSFDGLVAVLDAARGLTVVVVGDLLLDEYLHGGAARVAREAPVPAVTVTRTEAVPGGAGNLAANLAALGAHVKVVGVVGDDEAGATLRTALADAGVDDSSVVTEPGRRTVVKRRLVAEGQLIARFDEGDRTKLPPVVLAELGRHARRLERHADAVVVSDYGYGALGEPVVRALVPARRRGRGVLTVDAHDPAAFAALRPTAVTPSFGEVAPLLPAGFRDVDGPARADAVRETCALLHEATGAHIVAVTLDRDGSVVCEQDRPPYRTWTRPAPHSRACGAGDSYTAGLTLALAAGASTTEAAEFAQAAAAVVTARDGTVTCSADDLREHLSATTTPIMTAEALTERVAFHRRQGRRIVFTNGCFDLLHRGHVDLLNRAKALGDVLVVGLNTDAGVRELKGPGRPLTSLEDRAQVLAALSCVDHLVAFDEPTASRLVELLRPDVYVKGGDVVREAVPEAPLVEAYGGQVRILPHAQDRSTTAIVERIRSHTVSVPSVNETAETA